VHDILDTNQYVVTLSEAARLKECDSSIEIFKSFWYAMSLIM